VLCDICSQINEVNVTEMKVDVKIMNIVCDCMLAMMRCFVVIYLVLVHGQVTIIFVVSVGLSVCLFVQFFSAVFDPDFDQTWT